MDVLISGSSGLVGGSLRAALEAEGHRPIRLVRPGSRERSGDTVRWDPSAGEVETGGLEGVDAVVHLAGEPLFGRWTAAKKRRIRDSRVGGTQLLATTLAGLDRPPRVLLSASGIHYYGRDRGDEWLTESAPPGDGFLARVCRDWEAATRPAEEAGIRVVRLRTAPVLDPDGDFLKLQLPFFRLGLGGRLGSGRQWMSWIAMDDHVAGQLHLIDDERVRGPVNMCAPNPVRNAEFAQTLGRVLNRPAVMVVPRPAVGLLFGRDFAEEMAAASQRVRPGRLVDETGFRFRFPYLEDALRHLLDRPR